ncbi:MAG: hypothetical protein ACJAS1_002675 [Oleiphilaceae bacterium]
MIGNGLFAFKDKTMQILHFMPDIEELALSTVTAISVVEQLVEPFGTIQNAKKFWKNYPCILVCLTEQDDAERVFSSLNDELHHFIELADSTPEFIEPLPKGYQLSLTIINDAGNGLYLIKPSSLSLTQE